MELKLRAPLSAVVVVDDEDDDDDDNVETLVLGSGLCCGSSKS